MKKTVQDNGAFIVLMMALEAWHRSQPEPKRLSTEALKDYYWLDDLELIDRINDKLIPHDFYITRRNDTVKLVQISSGGVFREGLDIALLAKVYGVIGEKEVHRYAPDGYTVVDGKLIPDSNEVYWNV
jgi:hypothetical protein